MRIKLLLFTVLFSAAVSVDADQRPNLLLIMMDDLGYGQCQFNNARLTVDQCDPYFVELVQRRQDYTPEQALEMSRRAMPSLTRLSENGVVFSRAFAASPLCAPARYAIATGRRPGNAGIFTNMDVESRGIKPGTHLAHVLQDAGYATAHIGKWHIGKRDDSMLRDALKRHGVQEQLHFFQIRDRHPKIYNELWDAGYYGSVTREQNPLNNGFDYYCGYNNWASQFYDSTLGWEGYKHAGRQAGYNTEIFTRKALEFIRRQVEDEKPFFVQLHYHAVHDYLEPNAPDRYWNGFRSPSYPLSNFYAHINAVDQNVNQLAEFLRRNGQLENTLIAFTSDNGAMAGGPSVLPGNAPFSGHKGMLNQGGTRIPLFFHWPAGIQSEGRRDELASSMDILPTFIEAAGQSVPAGLEAKSLLGLLNGSDSTPVHDHLTWSGIHSRAWGFMIHRSFETADGERPRAPGGWAILRGNHLLRFTGTVEPGLYRDMPEGLAPRLVLYDIRSDPAETIDLSDRLPELLLSMKKQYLKAAGKFQPPVAWDRSKWEELVE